jgi:hypothetical protein
MLNVDLSAKAGESMTPALFTIGMNSDLRADDKWSRRFSFKIFFDPGWAENRQ